MLLLPLAPLGELYFNYSIYITEILVGRVGPTLKMEKKISLGELFVVKILGPWGLSMYHKTFGNMIHPKSGSNYFGLKEEQKVNFLLSVWRGSFKICTLAKLNWKD